MKSRLAKVGPSWGFELSLWQTHIHSHREAITIHCANGYVTILSHLRLITVKTDELVCRCASFISKCLLSDNGGVRALLLLSASIVNSVAIITDYHYWIFIQYVKHLLGLRFASLFYQNKTGFALSRNCLVLSLVLWVYRSLMPNRWIVCQLICV